jgi:hypothetical protein
VSAVPFTEAIHDPNYISVRDYVQNYTSIWVPGAKANPIVLNYGGVQGLYSNYKLNTSSPSALSPPSVTHLGGFDMNTGFTMVVWAKTTPPPDAPDPATYYTPGYWAGFGYLFHRFDTWSDATWHIRQYVGFGRLNWGGIATQLEYLVYNYNIGGANVSRADLRNSRPYNTYIHVIVAKPTGLVDPTTGNPSWEWSYYDQWGLLFTTTSTSSGFAQHGSLYGQFPHGIGGSQDWSGTTYAQLLYCYPMSEGSVMNLLVNPLQMFEPNSYGGYITESVIQPPNVTLVAVPDIILLGQSSILTWGSTYATTLTIDQGVGVVAPPSGNVVVSPLVTTTYTITANNVYGSSVATATVIVNTGAPPTPPHPPPIVDPSDPAPPIDPPANPTGHFRLYQKDCEIRVKQWGSTEGYTSVKPFGGPHFTTGAEI